MSDDGHEPQSRGSLDFVESSIIETIIPLSTDTEFEKTFIDSLRHLNEDNASPYSIAQRQRLFFDETISIYVVLQTPYFDKETLRPYLARLIVNLEVQIANASTESNGVPPSHEIIFSKAVDRSQKPCLVLQNPYESDKDGLLVLWKIPVVLSRPGRLRLHSPSVMISAAANLRPDDQVENSVKNEEYLPSQVPAGLNLLESFSNDPDLGKFKPRLSALRVSRVSPTTQSPKDSFRPLRNIARRSLAIVPALNLRTRYSRPNSTPSNPAILASLDIEINSLAGTKVILEQAHFIVPEGEVEDLNIAQAMKFPMTCLPRDEVTLLYRILRSDLETTKSNIKPLQISVLATIIISPQSSAQISMRWSTTVDFTLPLNPGYGTASPTIQRDHRPSQLSISTLEPPSVSSLAATHPDALPTIELTTKHQRSLSIPDFGVTMTFIAPSLTLPLGELFSWQVFIVNRSDRPRKLALLAVAKRRRNERAHPHRPPSSGYGNKNPAIADAVLDENILYAMQRNAAVEPAEIICYSTDVRIGPLAPSACHAVELKFLPMRTGILGLECVRVVDLGTQEHVDVRDLPSIVVGEA